MSEQPNLSSTFESYGSSAAAAYSRNLAEVDIALHESDLPSADEGRRLARERIAAVYGPEVPPVTPPQLEIAQVGMNLVDLRMWEQELMGGNGEEARTFRQVHAAFERQASNIDLQAREQELRNGSDASSESLRNAHAAFELQARQADMMGYEVTNVRN